MTILDPARSDQFRTAAQHASFHVPTARRDELATHVLDAMRGQHYDSAAAVAVLDGDQLLGLVTIEKLFAAPPAVVHHEEPL